MNDLNRAGAARIFLWVYSAPVLTAWTILSFLPLAGARIEGAPALSVAGDAAFFALGFWGLFAVYVSAIFLAAAPETKSRIARMFRGRIGLVSAYATVWIVSYWLFKLLLV